MVDLTRRRFEKARQIIDHLEENGRGYGGYFRCDDLGVLKLVKTRAGWRTHWLEVRDDPTVDREDV